MCSVALVWGSISELDVETMLTIALFGFSQTCEKLREF